VVDEDIDIHNPHEIEWAMATRFQGDRDMIIKKEKGSEGLVPRPLIGP
jgi:2,5-furandicarboxylate decarboxylase 1